MVHTEIGEALARVRKVCGSNQSNVIQSEQMLRPDRELLLRTKWLQPIMKGWYLLVKPELAGGDSSAWYASFWDFLRLYLADLHQGEYCLSAENSLDLHTGNSQVPSQVVVISSKGGGSTQELPYQTSLLVYADPKNLPEETVSFKGLKIMSLPYALCRASVAYFQRNQREAEIALQMIRQSAELTHLLLKYDFKMSANRLMGAYEALGRDALAGEMKEELSAAGWRVKAENPFYNEVRISQLPVRSPYCARILSLWQDYREVVIASFPSPQSPPSNGEAYLETLEDLYEKDAYHSLSIEGYHVDEALIERVQKDEWNPDHDRRDSETRNALAARGYYEAFLEVKKSLLRLIQGENPGKVIEQDLRKWYQHLFAPLVRAEILRKEELVGYRKHQVYIRNSRHVPLPRESLIDAMETLFECLKQEPHPAARAVLGHYIFVFIHPYMDGNGRLGRFLMNTLLVSGGYPWTIVRVSSRSAYLNALECAGTGREIAPFARFIASQMITPLVS